ncbi:MAG: alpha/beta fold hydrolase [Candidatus Levybacteria bacterium]|nr:alpha/beta fold hydrolase [Candidatus Levybacteria bacterium]
MINKRILIFSGLLLFVFIGIIIYARFYNNPAKDTTNNNDANLNSEEEKGGPKDELHPLSIENMRKKEYPGSDIVIEQTLSAGSNYSRYIASYKSEGLKIYALLTVPTVDPPKKGWPVIIFNHGYIPPNQYVTTERYIAYTDAFSRNGYIVFRSDYRGHGNSEGNAAGGYGSNAYVIDILNAVSSIKKYKNVDPDRIGMWGHSMGGHITLRAMVSSKDVKAGVIWAGVVASYTDLLNNWRRRSPILSMIPGNTQPSNPRGWRNTLVQQYGKPDKNPQFWNSISANSYLKDISGPLQLHHGTADHSVPHEFSEKLSEQMKEAKKEVELYIYPGDEHDIPNNFGIAMQRSVDFFDKHLK